MTELPYLADIDAGYVREFRARIQALPPGGVVLDRTFFYPTGGGQPSDRGVLRTANGKEVPVTDVSRSGTTVVHRVGRSPSGHPGWAVGDEVGGAIDWERRYRHMRLHTAQHTLSAVVFRMAGLRTRRAVFQGPGGYIDLEAPWPPDPATDRLKGELDELFQRRVAVRIKRVPRDEFDRQPSARSGLVPLPSNVDPVRIIAIEGLDDCPCGGTHVRSTAEVGGVDLVRLGEAPAARSRLAFTLREIVRPTPSG